MNGAHIRLVGSGIEHHGEVGYLHGNSRSWITPEFQEYSPYIFDELIGTLIEYFKSVWAYGLFSPDITQEGSKFDTVLQKVLADKGFRVQSQNIVCQMRKDLRMPEIPAWVYEVGFNNRKWKCGLIFTSRVQIYFPLLISILPVFFAKQ